VSKFYTIEDGSVIVTVSTGVRLKCLPYWNEVIMAGSALSFPDKPDAPTYTMIDADKDEFEIPYTQEAIDDPKTPDEDKALWAEYLDQMAEYDSEVMQIRGQKELMRTRVMSLKATEFADPFDLDAWAEEQRDYYGIPAPKDPRDLRLYYFASEVVKVELDGAKIMAGIARASGMTEDQLDSIEELFPDPLGRAERADPENNQETTPSEKPAST